MIERAFERKDLAAINAEEKKIEQLIVHRMRASSLHFGRVKRSLSKRKKRRSGFVAF
jgi:hypothetical protein